MSTNSIKSCKPFLRWVGGKSWLVKKLPDFLGDLEYDSYYEPFVGGASVFFFLQPKKAFLSDINSELIEMYKAVQNDVDSVIEVIEGWGINPEQYYTVRSMIPEGSAEKAARFIYLNRTSYNGIYRVNQKGDYNVPYGKNDSYKFDFERIRASSSALEGVSIDAMGYEDAISRAKKKDLVFIDPPYTVAHNNNGFIEYNKKLFSLDDQERLKTCIEDLDKKGAYYILTNAAHDTVKEIFQTCGQMKEISRYSGLGGKNAKRESIKECVFTNIPNAFEGEG